MPMAWKMWALAGLVIEARLQAKVPHPCASSSRFAHVATVSVSIEESGWKDRDANGCPGIGRIVRIAKSSSGREFVVFSYFVAEICANRRDRMVSMSFTVTHSSNLLAAVADRQTMMMWKNGPAAWYQAGRVGVRLHLRAVRYGKGRVVGAAPAR